MFSESASEHADSLIFESVSLRLYVLSLAKPDIRGILPRFLAKLEVLSGHGFGIISAPESTRPRARYNNESRTTLIMVAKVIF